MQRRIKKPLDDGQDNEKDGLKLNIKNDKTMAPGPITSWQMEGEKWKQ